MRLARRPQGPELAQCIGQGAFGLGDRRVEVELPRRQWLGQCTTLDRKVRLGRRPLLDEPGPIPIDRLEVAGEPCRPKLEVGEQRPRRVVRFAALALGLGPLGQLGCHAGGGFLGCLERGHRPIRLGPVAIPPDSRLRRAAGGFVPSAVGGDDEGVGELLAGRQPGCLLLGLGGEPAGLRPQLGEDVLDPGEVRLGLGELVLGLPATPLVATDAGDVLEQRPPLLGPQARGPGRPSPGR